MVIRNVLRVLEALGKCPRVLDTFSAMLKYNKDILGNTEKVLRTL
jgi:hypothetical protein